MTPEHWPLLFIPAIMVQMLWRQITRAIAAVAYGARIKFCAHRFTLTFEPSHMRSDVAIALAPLAATVLPLIIFGQVGTCSAWVFMTVAAVDLMYSFSARLWGDDTHDINKIEIPTAACVVAVVAVGLAWAASTALTVVQMGVMYELFVPTTS